IRPSCPAALCPGGGGAELGTFGICAAAGQIVIRRAERARSAREIGKNWRKDEVLTSLTFGAQAEMAVPRDSSVARSVVAGFRVDIKGRQSLWSAQLDLNLSPARIMCFIAWPISQDILVSQLHTDFRRNVRQFVEVLDRENAAAGHFGHFV